MGPIAGIKLSARLNSRQRTRIDPDATAHRGGLHLPASSPLVHELFAAMHQIGGGLDDDPTIRRSRWSEWTKERDFGLEPSNFGVAIVERSCSCSCCAAMPPTWCAALAKQHQRGPTRDAIAKHFVRWGGGRPSSCRSIDTAQSWPKRRHDPVDDTARLGALGRRQHRNHFVYPVPANVSVDLRQHALEDIGRILELRFT